jgi:peptidoglycan/xylan/chitin deacetylase (PgdA/CDA1 family)
VPLQASHRWVDPLLLTGTAGAAWLGGWPAGLAAGSLVIGMHAWAVVHPRSSYYMPVAAHVAADDHSLALTCDDGPWPATTPRILDLLAQYRQQATFFVIGQRAAAQGPLLRRILAEGHALGLHSHQHHRLMNLWGPRAVREDLVRCQAAIAEASGVPAPRLFRPPMGLKNPLIGRLCRELGLHCVTWTASGRDGGRPTAAERILRYLGPHLRPGAILAVHDGCEPGRDHERQGTVAAIAALLPQLHTQGLASRALQLDDAGRLRCGVPHLRAAAAGPAGGAVMAGKHASP